MADDRTTRQAVWDRFIDDLDRAGAGGHQFLVGDDAELVVDGGQHVLDPHRLLIRYAA